MVRNLWLRPKVFHLLKLFFLLSKHFQFLCSFQNDFVLPLTENHYPSKALVRV